MNFLQKLRSPKGFTLVELIIVIMIIGILAATLLPKVMGAPAKARDAARQADFNALVTALEMYFADNDEYPTAAAGMGAADLVAGGYLKNDLQDPVDDGVAYSYYYCTASVRDVPLNAFAITTRLETATGSETTITVGTVGIVEESTGFTDAPNVNAAPPADYTAVACAFL